MDTYNQRLDQLVGILKTLRPVKVYAYGSRIWGKAGKDSDIDLMVVMPEGVNVWEVQRKIASKLWESDYSYDLEPDIHVAPRDKFEFRLRNGDPFVQNVVRGKVVYEA